jgi:hypothetical protein
MVSSDLNSRILGDSCGRYRRRVMFTPSSRTLDIALEATESLDYSVAIFGTILKSAEHWEQARGVPRGFDGVL